MTAFQYRPIRPRLYPPVLPYRRHFLRVAVRSAVLSIRPVCGGCDRRRLFFQGRFETARLSGICFRAAYFQTAPCACIGVSFCPFAPAAFVPRLASFSDFQAASSVIRWLRFSLLWFSPCVFSPFDFWMGWDRKGMEKTACFTLFSRSGLPLAAYLEMCPCCCG